MFRKHPRLLSFNLVKQKGKKTGENGGILTHLLLTRALFSYLVCSSLPGQLLPCPEQFSPWSAVTMS